MANRRECWARVLADCEGPLTGEHIVSDCLLGEMVTVEGLLGGPPKSIGKASLVVNALCESHNNRLSPCDAAAKQMSEAADWMFADSMPNDSPDLVLDVSGFRFAQWMAKTACNHAARVRLPAPEEWVRYAFADHDSRAIGAYFIRTHGDPRPFPRSHYKWTWIGATHTDLGVAACFYFNGLMSVVSTVPEVENLSGVSKFFREVMGVEDAEVLPRPNRIVVSRPTTNPWSDALVRRGTIEIHW